MITISIIPKGDINKLKKSPDNGDLCLLNYFQDTKPIMPLGEAISVFIHHNLNNRAKVGPVAEDQLRSVPKTPGFKALITDQHNINPLRVDLKVRSGKRKSQAKPFDVLREYQFLISRRADYSTVFNALKDVLIDVLRKYKLPGALIKFRGQNLIIKPSALKSH